MTSCGRYLGRGRRNRLIQRPALHPRRPHLTPPGVGSPDLGPGKRVPVPGDQSTPVPTDAGSQGIPQG